MMNTVQKTNHFETIYDKKIILSTKEMESYLAEFLQFVEFLYIKK